MKAIRTVLACIRRADQTYNMINNGDKIIVGLSGGKDSVVLTYSLCLYQRFSHINFTIQPVIMDLGFPEFDASQMREFCESLGLNLIVSDNKDVYKILKIQQKDAAHLPCSICSRMKKAAINKIAKELGYNKVAFAHHTDDAIETLIMNEIYGGRIATFSPKMHLERADIEFIRPLLLVRENDISKMIKEENLPVSSSHCPADKTTTREEIKNILSSLYKKYPCAKENFLTMLSNYHQEDLWGKETYLKVNGDGLTLKPVVTSLDALIMSNIRHEVFVVEQNIDYKEEFILEEEKQAESFVIYLNETPIGTVRYIQEDRDSRIGRLCILKEYRNKGYASQVVKFLVDMLGAKNNPCEIIVNAQIQAKEFYSKLGFERYTKEFIEAGIVHIGMKIVVK